MCTALKIEILEGMNAESRRHMATVADGDTVVRGASQPDRGATTATVMAASEIELEPFLPDNITVILWCENIELGPISV